MTARALVLSALAAGPSTLRRPLRARDTELMAAGLRALGTHVSIGDDERWLVRPHPLVGPAHVDVGPGRHRDAVPAAGGRAWPTGRSPSTATRTPAPGRSARWSARCARSASGSTSPATGGLPLTVHGTGRVAGGEVVIDASASSQLVSGLLLAAPALRPGHRGPPRRPAGAHRAAPADDRADAAGRRRRGRRQHPRRLGRRARPAHRARLGHRAGPLRRRAVLRRRPGHRRRGDPAGLAAQQRPAGRAAPRAATADGRRGHPDPPTG